MSEIYNYHTCQKFKNKKVRVVTRQGATYIGTIVNVDDTHIYLRPEIDKRKARISFVPIIPLVLFDLLAIFLFTTPFFI